MSYNQPTLKEIAKQLNISVSTVSRALHNHYSIGLRTRTQVHKLANELNYEPNQTAIFFKQKKTFMIGVILPNLSEDFFANMVNGIEDVAYKKKYTVLLCQSRDNEEREKQLVEAMKSNRVDGLLISIAKNTTNYDHFELLKKFKIPVVFFDRVPKMPDIHYIATSLESGMRESISLLVKRKHRNIAMINGPEKLPASQDRLEYFIHELRQNHMDYDPAYVVTSDLSRESTYLATQRLLDLEQRPTAIIAFNDYVAMDSIKYAKKSKIKVNKDIYFVSFANQPICDYMDSPPIASVEQFPYQQGEKATEILLQLLERNSDEVEDGIIHNILLQSRLVMHDSK
jgi:LacI family transcriptional regulator, repressor for deo operon, udp, cdd, tsx, nupC, and nupG